MKKLTNLALAAIVMTSMVSCSKKYKPTEEQKKLMEISWKYDSNANLDGTGIKLGGDIASIADFASEKLYIGVTKKGDELVYEKEYGSGLLSSKTTGKCEFKDADKTIILTEWNTKTGA